jgi:glycosyltransferase involved in cell wall biosynthesis
VTLYFDCPETPEPIGGIKQIYRQVDVLVEHGIPARLVHHHEGFRCDWFPNQTPVTYLKDLRPEPDDIIVLPECRPEGERSLSEVFPELRRVVFNQNCYLTFKDADMRAGLDGYRSPYEDPKTVAIIAVSEDSRDVLEYMFPSIPVYRVKCGIDTNVFQYAEHKEPVISFIVRKNKVLREVLHGLRIRGSLKGYDVVPIHRAPERTVAETMRKSRFFLTALNYEGFGLPPAEAMASGCVVVGFDGRAGREYFSEQTGFPVDMGDLGGFLRTVESALHLAEVDMGRLDRLRRHAASFIASEYSLEQEAQSIVAAWRQILS